MKHLSTITIGTLLLAACAPSMGNGGMMQEHHNMMNQEHGMGMNMQQNGAAFLPGQGEEVSSFPEAKPSEVLKVENGSTISLNPTLVRKKIGGKEMAMYGYNGEIPGPTISAKQGSTFTVKVTNNIDLPTTVHWHGIRVDNKNDGTDGVTQEAIPTGGSYEYTITVPDEGMYWYHTHVREDVEQPMGLYGAILVAPSKSDAYASVDSEQALILNDLLVAEDGSPVPYGSQNADHTLMGRFGNVFLVNGKEPEPLEIGLGSVVRFSILNASNTRTYRIQQPKGSLLKIVGGDSGRYEKEFFADSFTLSPSERVIAEMYFWDDDVNHGRSVGVTVPFIEADDPAHPAAVVSAKIVGGVVDTDRLPEFKTLRTNADVVKSIDPFRAAFAKEPDHTLLLDLSMMGNAMGHGGMMMGNVPKDGIEWEDTAGMMNTNAMGSMMQWKIIDEATDAANDKITYTAKKGDQLKIRIVNSADSAHPMQHPIHFHGQRFLVLADNGVKNDDLVWKDTVLVRAGHAVDILLDASNPGDWMFHCHIAEHLSNGMMGMLKIE